MILKYIEFKSTVLLVYRYLFPLSFLLILLLKAFNSDSAEYMFILELSVIGHTVFSVGVFFGSLEKYKIYFMSRRSSYFITKLLMVTVYNILFMNLTHSIDPILIVLFTLISLQLALINKNITAIGILMYIYLKSNEIVFINHPFNFNEEYLYVILVIVLLAVTTFITYLYKEVG